MKKTLLYFSQKSILVYSLHGKKTKLIEAFKNVPITVENLQKIWIHIKKKQKPSSSVIIVLGDRYTYWLSAEKKEIDQKKDLLLGKVPFSESQTFIRKFSHQEHESWCVLPLDLWKSLYDWQEQSAVRIESIIPSALLVAIAFSFPEPTLSIINDEHEQIASLIHKENVLFSVAEPLSEDTVSMLLENAQKLIGKNSLYRFLISDKQFLGSQPDHSLETSSLVLLTARFWKNKIFSWKSWSNSQLESPKKSSFAQQMLSWLLIAVLFLGVGVLLFWYFQWSFNNEKTVVVKDNAPEIEAIEPQSLSEATESSEFVDTEAVNQVDPGIWKVAVLNATTIPGLASDVAEILQADGIEQITIGNTSAEISVPTVYLKTTSLDLEAQKNFFQRVLNGEFSRLSVIATESATFQALTSDSEIDVMVIITEVLTNQPKQE